MCMSNELKEKLETIGFGGYNWIDMNESNNIPIWKPEKIGSIVVGEITDKQEHIGMYDQLVVTITDKEDPRKKVNIFCNSVLKQQLQEIEINTLVCVEYKGEKLSKNNRKYRDYSVYQGMEV